MNRFRKALCVALVLLLLVASVPAVPVADLGFGITASALNATGKCGKTATYTFDSATGKLTIEGTGKINAEAFYQNQDIWKVVIGDGITEIGADAFNYCTMLTTVDFGNTVTVIGDNAFDSCVRLKSVTIPDSVTTIGNSAFSVCDSLTSVTIGDSVTTIGGSAFFECYSLTSVIMGDSVTTIGDYAFYSCSSLTSVIMGDSVTTIGNEAFCSCDKLESVIIPDSVITIGHQAFYSCDNLSSVDIGNGVTTIEGWAFAYCDNLTSVTVGSSVETIDYNAFYNCTSLESINIPKTVTYIGEEAFRYCPSLTDVYYEGAEENWNAIQIWENNTGLENAEIHFAETHTHTWDVEEITKYPTCTEKGEKTISCKGAVCKKTEEIPAFGHNFVDYYSNNDATCKEDGTKTAECNRCWGEKDTIVDEGSKDKVAHKFDNGKCTVCGAYADSCQHNNLAWYDGYDATCTSEGFKEHYECKDCYKYLDSNKEVIDKNDLIISIIPHDVEGVEYRKYDDVYHSKKCNMCGADVAYALHEYKDVISTVLPTCVTEGAETKMCVCGDTKTEALPINDNHDWYIWTEVFAPTCTTDGAKERICKREGCTAKETAVIEKLGHDMFVIGSIVPNCQTVGNNEYYGCDRCYKYFKDAEGKIETTKEAETLAKGEHVFTKYVIIKDATCTANAVEKATCDICWEATHERAIPGTMVAHTFKNYVSDCNATCIADGTKTAVCVMCKEAKDTKVDVGSYKSAPHTPDKDGIKCTLCGAELVCTHIYYAEKRITKTPTCTKDGEKAIVCSKCHANKPGSEEVVPATGHAWSEGVITKSATCKEKGTMRYTCNNKCGETKTEEIPVVEHNYKEVITYATCTEDGYSTFTCTMCGSHYVDNVVKAYGHMFDTYFHDEGSSTCYKDGTKTAECANGCGAKNTVYDPNSKTDHEMTDFAVITAATCTEDGEEEAKCFYYDYCGYSELVPTDALGHDETADFVEVKAATCTEKGEKTKTCKRCPEIVATEEIPALGHNYINNICTRCGAVNGNPTPDTGDHTYPDQWSVIIPATCKETGVAVKVCFDCHEVIAMVVPKVGHSDFDGDSKCDTCGGTITVVEPEKPAEKPEEKPCNCDCHAGGIKAFFFKLINFFAKIFDKNARVCDCGKAH